MKRTCLALLALLPMPALATSYIVTPPRNWPQTLDDSASGRHYALDAFGKTVIATQGGKELWRKKLLTDDPEYIVRVPPSGEIYARKPNRIIGIRFSTDKKDIVAAVPGDGISCWETLDAATGADIEHGSCD